MRTGCKCNPTVGTWTRQWRHRIGRGKTDFLSAYRLANSSIFQFFEEVALERGTGDILRHLLVILFYKRPHNLVERTGLVHRK